MKNKLKWLFAGLTVAFALLQFTNPPRTNPPVAQDLMTAHSPPPAIAAMLHAACYDCHSNNTRWPWYSRVAPMSWLIADDVKAGRKHLNLSEWPADHPERSAKLLDRMSEEIDYGAMPPKKYTAIHADARLTEADRKTVTAWLDAQAARIKPVAGN